MIHHDGPAPVIVGIDGSDGAVGAVRWATREAGLRQLPLAIVSVTPAFDPRAIYAGVPPSYLHDLADAARADLSVALDVANAEAKEADVQVAISTRLLEGEPVSELVAISAEAEIFAVGLHGAHRTGIGTAGSLAWSLAGHSRSPVAVVSDRGLDRPVHGMIVVGVDSSAYSRRALDLAFREASIRGAELRVVHAWTWLDIDSVLDPINTVPFDRPRGESITLAEMLAGYREEFPDVEVRQQVIEGRPGATLAAAAEHADLLVVGNRGRGGFASMVLGSTSHRLLGTVECPLLIAH
ncbi:universal stress protein [Jongsikchunia kroppenstedtii]|uniref:universal stress protein n=1 Tax=Jongsikchunia kroppenstedtii TaxID=1121721 RepID=UPI00037DEE69|nr:universal stress protein [Jongsikchunia kroppenstedtii]